MPRGITDAEIKAIQRLVQSHPHPEKLLEQSFMKLGLAYIPETIKQGTDFAIEYVAATAKAMAIVSAIHITDHPEEAKECVPHMLEVFKSLLEREMKTELRELTNMAGLEYPFEAKSINEVLRDEIIETLRESEHGKG